MLNVSLEEANRLAEGKKDRIQKFFWTIVVLFMFSAVFVDTTMAFSLLMASILYPRGKYLEVSCVSRWWCTLRSTNDILVEKEANEVCYSTSLAVFGGALLAALVMDGVIALGVLFIGGNLLH